MNWQLFSILGYASVALWLLVPVLIAVHQLRRPRRWWAHIALGVAVLAWVCATANSNWHVVRLQEDQAQQQQAQMQRLAEARKALEEQRGSEVADVRFAEDASGEFLDRAGLSDADLRYFDSVDPDTVPAWQQQQQQRSTDDSQAPDDLTAMIGAKDEQQDIEPATEFEQEQGPEPILLPARQVLLGNRLDAANLKATRWIVLLCVVFLVFDYIRRLNVQTEVYCPLPLPSAWADALTPRPVVTTSTGTNRQALLAHLTYIARRGEVFLLLTDDEKTAAGAVTDKARLPLGLWPMRVLDVTNDKQKDGPFVFESLWFGRYSFVITDADQAEATLRQATDLLAGRRRTRARTRQTVHVIWDRAEPMPRQFAAALRQHAANAGFVILIRNQSIAETHDATLEPTEAMP